MQFNIINSTNLIHSELAKTMIRIEFISTQSSIHWIVRSNQMWTVHKSQLGDGALFAAINWATTLKIENRADFFWTIVLWTMIWNKKHRTDCINSELLQQFIMSWTIRNVRFPYKWAKRKEMHTNRNRLIILIYFLRQ